MGRDKPDSTIYRIGARSFWRAMKRMLEGDSHHSYDPFSQVHLKSNKPATIYRPLISPEEAKRLNLKPLVLARLNVLLAFLNLGLSVAEACACEIHELVRGEHVVHGYGFRPIKVGQEAMEALRALVAVNEVAKPRPTRNAM